MISDGDGTKKYKIYDMMYFLLGSAPNKHFPLHVDNINYSILLVSYTLYKLDILP